MMKFIFWQNVLSIHQSVFLRSLSQSYDVTLIVEREIRADRLDSGWHVPDMGNTKIVIAPEFDKIEEILKKEQDSIHVFSGTHAYPLVRRAFTCSRKLKLKTLVMSEPYNFLGFKGILRRVRNSLRFARYKHTIHGYFATGQLGVHWVKKAGFPLTRIYEWGYFTEMPESVQVHKAKRNKPSILFVGIIDKRKNILHLISVAQKNVSLFDELIVVGNGPLEAELNDSITNSKIKYLGKIPNQDVKKLMQNCDLLVLPSIFDGWGAVVNEALQNGMRVICSQNCGAASLLDNQKRGEVFYFNKPNDLESVLIKWLNKGVQTPDERNEIIEWCKNSISGEVVAEYFVDTCRYIFERKGVQPLAPWRR